jgi:hypothetical protein
VAAALLREPLAQRLHQQVPPAQRAYLVFFRLAQVSFRELLEPVARQFALQLFEGVLGAAKILREGAVETIVVALILDQAGSRQGVKRVCTGVSQTGLERFEESEKFRDCRRHAGIAQQKKEANEHSGGSGTATARTSARPARS